MSNLNEQARWNHNCDVLDRNNKAAFYAIMTAVINANDSRGESVWISDKLPDERVSTSPNNEAWYSVANMTLSSVADSWMDYAEFGENGNRREWIGFAEEHRKYAL